MNLIDVHTHAFPDALADRAIAYLEDEGEIRAYTDGRVGSLLSSMDRAGVSRSVVASIATKPEQFAAILTWSAGIASERLIPFPSVHPADPQRHRRVEEIREAGFKGVKLHPYYQGFSLDEKRIVELFSRIAASGLIVLLHTGFDLAFERRRIADPVRIRRLIEAVPDLVLVTTHFGAWEDWQEVEKHLLGRPVYMDTSYSLPFMGRDRAAKFLRMHPQEYLLFGSDSPWGDQSRDVELISGLGLGADLETALFRDNAERLLGMGASGATSRS